MFRKPHLLLCSQATIKFWLFVISISQFTAVAISVFYYPTNTVVVFSQETGEPIPEEGNKTLDVFEEDEFIMHHIPLVSFFSHQFVHTWYKEPFLNEVNFTLEPPPPETV